MIRRATAGVRRPRPPLRTRRRLVVPAVLAAAFTVVACVVLTRQGTPYAFDTGPHRWSVEHRPHAAVTAFRVVTDAGAQPFPLLAAALGGWLAARGTARRGTVAAALALLVLLVGQGLRGAVMAAARRDRPPRADWAVNITGFSFPSGHTAASGIAAGLLAWGLLRVLPRVGGRVAAGLCVLIAVAVGFSRVYLGVHWPSDVVGGWLFAALWLAVTLPSLSAWLGGADLPFQGRLRGQDRAGGGSGTPGAKDGGNGADRRLRTGAAARLPLAPGFPLSG